MSGEDVADLTMTKALGASVPIEGRFCINLSSLLRPASRYLLPSFGVSIIMALLVIQGVGEQITNAIW